MVEFVTNNAIWLIAGGGILIMALIGYFAENSELGKKVMQYKPKDKKSNKKEEKQTSTDAWTANVNTDKNAEEVIINNDVNSWMNNPLDFPASENLNEVNVSSLPNENYSNIEVLDFESDNNFDNVEVLDYDLNDEKEDKNEIWT